MLAVAIFSGLAAGAAGYGLCCLLWGPRGHLARLLDALERQGSGGRLPRPRPVWLALVRRLDPWLPAGAMADLRLRLAWAGRPGGLDPSQFYSLKLALALLLPALVPLFTLFAGGGGAAALALVLAALGFAGPDLWLGRLIAERRRRVRRELDPFIELVATAVEAGLGLGEAVRRVAADSPGLLAAEFLYAVREAAAGKPRAQAWQDLIDRHSDDDLHALVRAIVQAEQYGTGVAERLRQQLGGLRTARHQAAQKTAQAATVKMRFPMFFLIMVPFMGILLAPAVLNLARAFRR